MESPAPEDGLIFSAVRFVLMHSLRDRAALHKRRHGGDSRRMIRAVASSLPPALALLRTLVSRPLLVDSPLSAAMSRMGAPELAALVPGLAGDAAGPAPRFDAARFARSLHLRIAELSCGVWSDERFACAPAHVIHPWITYMGESVFSKCDF